MGWGGTLESQTWRGVHRVSEREYVVTYLGKGYVRIRLRASLVVLSGFVAVMVLSFGLSAGAAPEVKKKP